MSLTLFNETPRTMSSREIAELVEARHNDVVATIERLYAKGLLRSSRKTRKESTGGRPIEVYDLIERDTHLVVSGYSDEHRARVIDRWQELEQSAAPAIPKTFAEALRLAATQQEEIERLAIERDDAIKTKAYIGDKKTASAMGTASAAVRKANKLQEEVADLTSTLNVVINASKEYATITTVGRYTGITYKYGPLVRYCRDNSLAIRKIPDDHFGQVNSYPAEAWQAVHGVDISSFY